MRFSGWWRMARFWSVQNFRLFSRFRDLGAHNLKSFVCVFFILMTSQNSKKWKRKEVKARSTVQFCVELGPTFAYPGVDVIALSFVPCFDFFLWATKRASGLTCANFLHSFFKQMEEKIERQPSVLGLQPCRFIWKIAVKRRACDSIESSAPLWFRQFSSSL